MQVENWHGISGFRFLGYKTLKITGCTSHWSGLQTKKVIRDLFWSNTKVWVANCRICFSILKKQVCLRIGYTQTKKTCFVITLILKRPYIGVFRPVDFPWLKLLYCKDRAAGSSAVCRSTQMEHVSYMMHRFIDLRFWSDIVSGIKLNKVWLSFPTPTSRRLVLCQLELNELYA